MKTSSHKSEGRGQKSEVRGQRSEARPRKAAAKGPKAEVRPPTSDLRPLSPRTTRPWLVIISAPSGGGKTTLLRQLETRPNMVRVVTCTTRDPRPGERDGVDYHFLDAASFLSRVQAGNFLEHAKVYGHSYGTLKADVLNLLRQGKDALLTVDVQGAAAIRDRAE